MDTNIAYEYTSNKSTTEIGWVWSTTLQKEVISSIFGKKDLSPQKPPYLPKNSGGCFNIAKHQFNITGKKGEEQPIAEAMNKHDSYYGNTRHQMAL